MYVMIFLGDFMKEKIRYFIYFIVIISIELFCSQTLNSMGIGKENILMVFIVGVLLIATFTKGYFYGLLASIVSVLCFNFLYINPNYDFHISDPNDFMLILFFLMTSIIACSLTDRFQKQIIISKKNESISKQLYILSERLLNVSGIEHILAKGTQYIEESIQIKVNISLEIKEESKKIFPIIGINRVLGSIEILSQQDLNEDQMIIIKAAANQLGNALERELTYLEQEKIKVAMEREHMLNSMLRSISHDLRTPLTGIVGASQLMMDQENLCHDDVYSLAKDIHNQAHWLTQIVENILNMSKIESGNLVLHKNLEVVDDLIYEAIHHLPELEKRNVKVEVPDDLLLVNVDGKLMVQVLINILSNALKYTKEKDQITIQVKKIKDAVEFSIKDTGIGISKNILEHIFDEFVTNTNISNDSQKGIGLGLAICKAIIQAHGGKIEAKNDNEGACFIFTIPNEELNV